MTAPVKNHSPKIGEVYLARGKVDGFHVLLRDSYSLPAQMISLPEARSVPAKTFALLLDVCLLRDLFPELATNAIVYKVLSLELRTIIYVKMVPVYQNVTEKDYKMARHAFFLQFSEMSQE